MINKNSILSLGLACALAAASPASTWAVSPEFARTPEEWERLRDNVMEYEELADLIQEYNVTVENNRIDYNDFRKDYGMTKDEVARKYREMAEDIEDTIDYPAEDDSAYASKIASIAASESTIKSLREQADDNVEDSMVIWLGYQLAEATLVSSAQSNMISYQQKLLELQIKESSKVVLEDNYQSLVTRKELGMATQLEVLAAQENIQNIDKELAILQAEIKNVKQKLCTMLGWAYNAEPEIRDIPRADREKIDQIDLESDKQKALENNFTLQMNQRKLENATQIAVKESLANTVRDNEAKIKSSVMNAHQSLLTAKIASDRANMEAAAETQNMAAAEVKFQLGTISRLEYRKQQQTLYEKQVNQIITDMNLLQAQENYHWSVNGLAAAQ